MEEAQFDIYVAGKKIGTEKYSILSSEESASSASVLDFRDPGNRHQKVHMETQLNMDGRFVPRSYRLRTDVDGKIGVLEGTFDQAQAIFKYGGNGNNRRSGLLVGNSYCVLDTNVFHHFIFVARLFDYDAREKPQSFEVVVPQEMENGILRISHIGMEMIRVGGKRRNLHHLRADSGFKQIDMWVDDQRVLHRIALPERRIEVVRN